MPEYYDKDHIPSRDHTLEMFANSPIFLNLTVIRMLKMIHNPTEKFIFCLVYLLEFKQKDAADCLNVNESNIAHHVKNIKKRL